MASAVLASGNESSWAQSGSVFMGKLPHLNPNPNPKTKQKHFHHSANGGRKNCDFSPAVTQTASDDAYSFNQKPIPDVHRNGFNHGGYMTYNVASFTKIQLGELRKRLSSELEQVRNLRDRIDSSQFSGRNPNNLKSKLKKLSINKRPISSGSGSNKDSKRCNNGIYKVSIGNGGGDYADNEALLKECGKILAKLMKHKLCWIFNTPVDAKALGLHDYHQIVRRPMDLGTVKSNLSKSLYLSPAEFATDVRLTFDNALLYNPKSDQVHGWAEFLLGKFEEMFKPIQDRIGSDKTGLLGGGGGSCGFDGLAEELQGSSWNHIPTPERSKKQRRSPPFNPTHSTASTSSNPPPAIPRKVHSPVPTPSPVRAPSVIPQQTGRGAVGKQPKPRAKDPNKREMSIEEKHKLGLGLQSLPQEKMPQLLQIIRKRNEHLAQDGDEIELDIEALDTETLWELDRFVTNWKKMVSKTKRQALMMSNNTTAAAPPSNSNVEAEMDGGATSDRNDSSKKPRKGDAGDEDVDIDDDIPDASFPPVEIEKDEGGVQEHGNNASSGSSSSGSSSSDSSSSSGSDSGSSSGSDSDADDAQS